MKKIKVNPLQARVKGNIIPDWEELLTKTSFEDFHVTREKANSITWKGRERSVVRLNSYGEPVTLVVTSDISSILPDSETATLTIIAVYTTTENNVSMVYPVTYQQVYIYDNEKLIGTGATDGEGAMTFEYESSFSGVHELTIKTSHGNGFASATKKINMYVKYDTTLNISPIYTYELGFGEAKEIVATLIDSDRNPVADKPITFYEGFRELGTISTDKNGEARIKYMESENRGDPTVITLYHTPKGWFSGMPLRIKGNVSTVGGEPVVNREVTLYSMWHSGARKWVNTDSNGDFTLVYTPEFDFETPYYVAFKSRIMDSTNNQYRDHQPTWEYIGTYNITGVTANPFYMDSEHWDWGTLNGTSVPNGSLIDPSFDSEGVLSTGRGKVVYYVPRIPTDLTEWTLYCKIHGSNLYNRIGISTITTVSGNLAFDEDSTWLLKDLINVPDNTTSHDLEFKFLDNVCYVYVDGLYTGFSKEYSNTNNLHLISYSNHYDTNTNYPLTLEEVKYYDCVDLSTIPSSRHTVKTLNTDLNSNWTFVSRGEGSTTPTISDEGILQLGRYTHHLYNKQLDKNKIYTIYFYNPTPTQFVYMGLGTNSGGILSNLDTGSARGVINGINKAKIYYGTERWKTQYNDGTVYDSAYNAVVYLIISTVTHASSGNTKILAITEDDKED